MKRFFEALGELLPGIALIVVLGIAGKLFSTWL